MLIVLDRDYDCVPILGAVCGISEYYVIEDNQNRTEPGCSIAIAEDTDIMTGVNVFPGLHLDTLVFQSGAFPMHHWISVYLFLDFCAWEGLVINFVFFGKEKNFVSKLDINKISK